MKAEDVLVDLAARLRAASQTLNQGAAVAGDERRSHLRSKQEGVDLALDYLRGYTLDNPPRPLVMEGDTCPQVWTVKP